MKDYLRSFLDRFTGARPAEDFAEPAGRPDWEAVEAQRTERYVSVMSDRIARNSSQYQGDIVLPDTLYHASLHSGLDTLDPSRGQGLGVWFQEDLVEAAHFAVSRSTQPGTGEKYPDADPSIYEAKLNLSNIAVFPSEISLYDYGIEEDGDDEDLMFKPHGLNFDEIRTLLSEQGYDGIYLQDRETFAVINADAIEIVAEHDPLPIYNQHVRPRLTERTGSNPFAWVPD